MKSVKPGRGPSMMGGVASVFAVVFGIIWMCGAASMGAPGFFLLFGVAFIGIGVVRLLETVMASHWAYLSVAGVYVLLYVIVRVFRRRLFYRPIQRFLFRIFDSEGQ